MLISNMLHINDLIFTQRGNERLDNRLAYISFLARLTLKEVEVNSEYHAPRNFRFMVFFVLARDHEQLFQTFRGVCMLSSLLFIIPISNMLHMNNLIFTQINFNFNFSRLLN